jgi:predicted small lipoprotein YifL
VFKMKRVLVMSLALVALAGCGRKEAAKAPAPNAQTSGDQASGAAVSPPSPTAPPPRKPGLWRQTVSSDKTSQTTRICLDASVDKVMNWWGARAGKSACTENTITQRAGGGWDFHAVCETGPGGRTVSTGQASGDFSAHYTVDMTSVTTGAPAPLANGTRKIKIDAAWQGPCPADMKPGDMALPGGMKINLLEVMKKTGK